MRTVSPVWYVLVSIVTVQAGAAVAKSLFDVVPATGMTWLRLLLSAVLLVMIARPRLRGRDRAAWVTLGAYAAPLVCMNWALYQAAARIPLGIAVTIEFLGPLSVAVLTSRAVRDVLLALLAAAGVVMLGFRPTSLDPVGLAYALLAALGWGLYILATPHVGRRWRSLDALALASLAGAVLLAPAGLAATHGVLTPRILLAATAVAVLSSVIPYAAELAALRTLPTRVFSVLMSLEPAAAALAGLLLLHEALTPVDLLAMACVVLASIGVARSARTAPRD